ncbi:hypothetical protein TD95_000234 [Thielaviopsis punctulata]|uniref:Asparagine synthetase domain-containing protein n=1 Tax=Thielaviopsis punctulata TaxID=72032 RepID=A0A0F4ZDW3_9PEZI|nr:hypothetical protein TD95_000234 [Thielaviopsis punctulata]
MGAGGDVLQALNISKAKVAVLFSGGLDCTVLARLLGDILTAGEKIDLINVAFENPRIAGQFVKQKRTVLDIYEECPDRITGRRAFEELEECCPERRWRFIAANILFSETSAHKDTVVALMAPHNTEMDLSIANTPVQDKCDFHVDDELYGGIKAAKRVLRLVADDLGLHGAAREKKRAIQFCARTAKMQSGHVKGTAAIQTFKQK